MTEFASQSHHTEAEPAGWSNGKRRCYQRGQIQGGGVRDESPHQPFSNMFFDEYNFSIFLNLFNNNKPHAQSTHNRKYTDKMRYIWETLRFRGKKFKQNLRKNCSKSTKMATTVCKFLKIFRGSLPPDPPQPFLFSICFEIILPENTLENM